MPPSQDVINCRTADTRNPANDPDPEYSACTRYIQTKFRCYTPSFFRAYTRVAFRGPPKISQLVSEESHLTGFSRRDKECPARAGSQSLIASDTSKLAFFDQLDVKRWGAGGMKRE